MGISAMVLAAALAMAAGLMLPFAAKFGLAVFIASLLLLTCAVLVTTRVFKEHEFLAYTQILILVFVAITATKLSSLVFA